MIIISKKFRRESLQKFRSRPATDAMSVGFQPSSGFFLKTGSSPGYTSDDIGYQPMTQPFEILTPEGENASGSPRKTNRRSTRKRTRKNTRRNRRH